MPKKRTSPKSGDDGQTNEGSVCELTTRRSNFLHLIVVSLFFQWQMILTIVIIIWNLIFNFKIENIALFRAFKYFQKVFSNGTFKRISKKN